MKRELNIRELRIGNYIKDFDGYIDKIQSIINPNEDNLHWLSFIENTDKKPIIFLDNFVGPLHINMIDPVLLKEEWLLKFGFNKFREYKIYNRRNNTWWYQIEKHPSYKSGYIFFIDIKGINAPPSIRIKYVHQLQNLYFSLTGRELS